MQNLITKLWNILRYSSTQLETGIDDILFQNREKEYGAYMLRKNYPWHLMTALGLAGSLFLYACFLPVWLGWMVPKNVTPQPGSIKCFPDCHFLEPLPSPPYGQEIHSGNHIIFRIPKPALIEEIRYWGNEADKINTIDTLALITDPFQSPSQEDKENNPALDSLIFDPFFNETFDEEEEIPEWMCICDSGHLFLDPG